MESKSGDKLFLASCATYLVVLFAFVLIRISVASGIFNEMNEQAFDVIFSVVSQVGVMFLMCYAGMRLYRGKRAPQVITYQQYVAMNGAPEVDRGIFSMWGFHKPSKSTIGWAIGVGILLFFFNIFVSSFCNGILVALGHRGALSQQEDSFTGFGGFLIMLVLVSFLPGLCEEMAHRGMLFTSFRKRLGVTRAVLLSSLLFGLMHLNIVQFFYATVLGYLMCWAVVVTRTIWTAVIMHAMNNGISVYLSFARDNNWVGGNLISGFSNMIGSGGIFVYLLLFWGIYYLIVACIHQKAKDNFMNEHLHDENPPMLHRSRGMKAVKYYTSYGEKREGGRLNAVELTVLLGVICLGSVITVMTLIWGLL